MGRKPVIPPEVRELLDAQEAELKALVSSVWSAKSAEPTTVAVAYMGGVGWFRDGELIHFDP